MTTKYRTQKSPLFPNHEEQRASLYLVQSKPVREIETTNLSVIITNYFRKVNHYFFDEEKINISDFLWFYGTLSLITFLGVFVALLNLIF